MSAFEDFLNDISDATGELFNNIGDACKELVEDLNETISVKYLRLGGVAYCKSDCRRHYAIISGGNSVIALNNDGEPEDMKLQKFLDLHGAEKLKVAGAKRIAMGDMAVDAKARRFELDEERFTSSKAFVLACFAETDADSVNEALGNRFGYFEWLKYDIPEEIEEDSEEE